MPKSKVGVGLLTKASAHSTAISPDLTPSRASPLPQWIRGEWRIPSWAEIKSHTQIASHNG
ncbi:hypothetical protein C2E19_12410 [Pseudomonas sp. DTU12.3]|nr:hypothetical protein C2E19_12410 [Pseudomonas sp. DTU12.3]